MPLETKAVSIRLSTIAWPDTISITRMKAVSGPCVAAARKPTMPSAMSGMACSGGRPNSQATSRPMPAPTASEGANTPAGTPVHEDSQVAMNLSRV